MLSGSGSGGGSGGSGSVPGSPATGTVDFDCVLQPFNSEFDYKPATSVGGARPSPGAPVGVLARFGDLPGIAPVPIKGPMEVTAELTVAGKAVTVTGTSNVDVPPETAVPVPDLIGSVDAAEDTLPVTMTAFDFYFPSFDITGTCKAAGGQDLGDLKVGSGTVGGGSGPTGGTAPTGGGDPVTTDDPAVTAGGTASGEVAAAGSQNISVVDVRLEGARTLGELFGAAPRRTLVLVVQNVGSTVVEKPTVAVAMGRSSGLSPAPMDVAVGPLAPQQMQRIEVPMEMPRAGIGTYQLAGQVGSNANGSFGTSSQTYPWGLFLLNVAALGLFAWGVRRRLADRRSSRPALDPKRSAATEESEATVDLAELDGWFRRPRKGSPGLA